MKSNNSQRSKFFFITALVIFFLFHIALSVIPQSQRDLPIEPDDSYAYIQRAAQIEYCWLKGCIALEDISKQVLIDTQNDETNFLKNHLYHRTFPFIYPLHSLLIFLFNKLGTSWEISFFLIGLLCQIIVASSLGYFLKTLFGFEVAAISLLLLAGYIFESDLVHSNVPQSWAMFLALICWATILEDNENKNYLVPILIALPVFFHPSGPLYSIISSFLYLIKQRSKASRWKLFFFGFFLSITALIIQTLTPNPSLASGVQIGATRQTLLSLEKLAQSFETANGVIFRWAGGYWNGWIIFALALAGYLSLDQHKKKQLLPIIILVGGLLFASVLSSGVFRGFPPNLFARLWVLAGILLVGLLSQSILTWVQIASKSKTITFIRTESARLGVLALLGFFLFLALFDHAKSVLRNYPSTIHSKTERGNLTVSTNVNEFLETLDPDVQIIYGNEIIFHYALLHGAESNQAAYYPILLTSDQGRIWLTAPNTQLILDRSPISEELIKFLSADIEVISDNGDFVLARIVHRP